MNCRDAQELIPLHVGDDLPSGESAPLESHLENCVLCEAEYASFASAREALLLLRDEEVPTAAPLWGDVADGLNEDRAAAPQKRGVLRMLMRGGIAAALCVGATAPFWLPEDAPRTNPANDGAVAEAEGEGVNVVPVLPEELRSFFESWTGTIPAPGAEDEDALLMAPASNRGQM